MTTSETRVEPSLLNPRKSVSLRTRLARMQLILKDRNSCSDAPCSSTSGLTGAVPVLSTGIKVPVQVERDAKDDGTVSSSVMPH